MPVTYQPLPLISIVVPSYNQAGYLRDTFESIFRQQYRRLEVVVMDGGSTDGSVDIIREYAPRLKHWQSQRDGGQSAAINAGMRHCTGDLVGWLNSDDYFWGDCLWTLARAAQAHPGCGLYVGNGLRYVQSEARYHPFCTRHIAFNREALLRGVDSVLQPATFFLREAWEAVGGLDNDLRFCMDWDIYLRISRTYPVTVINDFLAVSREYEDTKTRSGKMDRAAEIIRMIRRHTGAEVTPGTLLYLFETLRDVTEGVTYPELRPVVRRSLEVIAFQVAQTYGRGGHQFPYESDSQDRLYVPVPRTGDSTRPYEAEIPWPPVSIVCRVGEHPDLASEAAESLLRHRYPELELIFAGPAAAVTELTGRFAGSKGVHCDRKGSPAHSINQGLTVATGEVLGWIEPEELLTQGALAEVGRAFAADPALDAVFGNALYTDREGVPSPFPIGRFRTALALGVAPGQAGLARYWLLPTLVPPPGLFFRRRVFERGRSLDDSRNHTHAHDYLANLVTLGKVNKLERTQVLRRLSFDAGAVEAELYARSRPHWTKEGSREFLKTWRSYVTFYLRRHFGPARRGLRFWAAACLAGVSSLVRLGNPERFLSRTAAAARTHPLPAGKRELEAPLLPGPQPRVRITACLTRWPDAASEQALFRRFRAFAHLDCFVLQADAGGDADSVHTPDTLRQTRPRLVRRPTLFGRVSDWLRSLGIPIPGTRTPTLVRGHLRTLQQGLVHLLQLTLQKEAPNLLLVSSEENPVATLIRVEHPRTRLVLLAQRPRLPIGPGWLESQRTRQFERDNYALYDGVVLRSMQDREQFVATHAFPAERIAILTADGDVEFVDGFGQVHRGVEGWMSQLQALPRRGNACFPDVPVITPLSGPGLHQPRVAA